MRGLPRWEKGRRHAPKIQGNGRLTSEHTSVALEIKVGIKGRDHLRINNEPLWWLAHTYEYVRHAGKSKNMDSRVVRRDEKFKVMSVVLRQLGTRSRPSW